MNRYPCIHDPPCTSPSACTPSKPIPPDCPKPSCPPNCDPCCPPNCDPDCPPNCDPCCPTTIEITEVDITLIEEEEDDDGYDYYCFSLKTGVVLTGLMSAILAILLTTLAIMYAINPAVLLPLVTGPSWLILVSAIIIAIICVFFLTLAILLLVGVFMDKPAYIAPFMFLIPALVFVIVVIAMVWLFFSIPTASVAEIFMIIFFTILDAGIGLFAFIVVASYYKNLRCRTK